MRRGRKLDALIVLDQVSEEDCGVVTKRVRDHLAELGEREPGKFVLADSRERIGQFRNVCVKPNLRRMQRRHAVRVRHIQRHDDGAIRARYVANVARRVVFCTRGREWNHRWRDPARSEPQLHHVPAYPVSGPIDIVGAGDSCSAGITSAMVSGLTHEQAAAFGNLVASITIQQIGVTGTATPEQVRARWREVSGAS